MTDLSIIIVSYNARGHLRGCLRSIENTTGLAAVQTTVVDNASADGSPEMVRNEFPRAQLLQNRANLGFAAAANVGLERATGRYMLLLNPDTLLTEGAPDRLVTFMDRRPEAAVCGCRLLNADGTIQPSCRMKAAYSLRYLALNALGLQCVLPPRWLSHDRALFLRFGYDRLREVDFVSGAALLLRRELLRTVGYLDERFFLYGEEMDWCYRCRQAGYRIVFFPGAEVIHFGGASAPSRAELELQLCRGRYQFVAKHFGAARAGIYRLLLLVKHAKSLPLALLQPILRHHQRGLELLHRKLRVLRWLLAPKAAAAEHRA